jgi:hypothetical protein
MKLSRTILAPLLALALILTQIAPFAEALSPAPQARCGCHLIVCCCQKQALPNSTPRPAAPARTVTQSDLQVVAAVLEQEFSSVAPPQPSQFHVRPSLGAAQIPLYRRDCVLLI